MLTQFKRRKRPMEILVTNMKNLKGLKTLSNINKYKDKVYFRAQMIARDREGHLIMKKRSIHQKHNSKCLCIQLPSK